MNILLKIILFVIILFFPLLTVFANNDIRVYKSIEFKDLYYLSKYEIIEAANISIRENNLLVNVSTLEKVLNDLPLIESFKISESNQRLIISIVENRPIFLLNINDGDRNVLAELDKEYRVISVNSAHAPDMSLISISNADMNRSIISLRLKVFLNMIYTLQAEGLPVMKEILEMDFTDASRIKVLLKGRRTVFMITPDYNSFKKLNYAAGYFDRIKYYPGSFTILDGLGILDRNS